MTVQEDIITYEIDAQGRRLGHIASEIAVLLMGKNIPGYRANAVSRVHVVVSNASLMDISQTKKDTKIYDRYTFYPGGRKEENMQKVITDKGYGEVLARAVRGMLPKNKLQSERMKKLTINE
ncbi:MAG: 50S ribosomal protein L13 [Patescibacteria group bacterium]